jgi:hypothetical protein
VDLQEKSAQKKGVRPLRRTPMAAVGQQYNLLKGGFAPKVALQALHK